MKRLLEFNNFLLENVNTFDFKELFLKLTEYTIPFGFERTIAPILYKIVPNLKKDLYGNYYIRIGNSKTLFTAHLDTYSKRRVKVNHIIDGDIIRTDGTTILGGDNKNGVVILLYMITKNVPGIYYFFIGEEGIKTGESCNGSTWLLKNNSKIYTTVDRAIAFDRRGQGSVVIKQRGRMCCSEEFADDLVEKFGELGIPLKKDYGYGTDSAVFMDIVPEITNLSSGGEYEHSFLETTDISYVEKMANAAVKMDWESLPSAREPKAVETKRSKYVYNKYINMISEMNFKKVRTLLGIKGFTCINEEKFETNSEMMFEQFVTNKYITLKIFCTMVRIVDSNYFNGQFSGGTVTQLKEKLNIGVGDLVKKVIGSLTNKMDKDSELTKIKLEKTLKLYDITYYQFKEFILKSDKYKGLFRFYPSKIYMDVRANQAKTIDRQKEQQNKINK
jgi:hypothetical protein